MAWKTWLEVAGVTVCALWIFNLVQIAAGGKSLERSLKDLKDDPFDSYRAGLAHGLMRFSSFIGKDGAAESSVWSARAFQACLAVATVYPILFSLAAWVASPSARMFELWRLRTDGTTLVSGDMPQNLLIWQRLAYLAALFAPLGLALVVHRLNILKSRPLLRECIGVLCFVTTSTAAYYLFADPAPVVALAILNVTFCIVAAQIAASGGHRALFKATIAAFIADVTAATVFAYWPESVEMPTFLSYFLIALSSSAFLCVLCGLCCCTNFLLAGKVTTSSVSTAVFASGAAMTLTGIVMMRIIAFPSPMLSGTGIIHRLFEKPVFSVIALMLSLAASVIFGALGGEIAYRSEHADMRGDWRWVAICMAMSFLPALLGTYIAGSGHQIYVTLIFLALLPAVNAPFDWLSLGATRWAVGRLLAVSERAFTIVEGPLGYVLQPLIFATNLLAAWCIAVLASLGTVAACALYDKIDRLAGGPGPFNVANILDHLAHDLDSSVWWVFGMVLWTLIPTIIYFFAYAAAFVSLALKPLRVLPLLAAWVETARDRGGLRQAVGIPVSALALAVLQIAPGFALVWMGVESLQRLAQAVKFATGLELTGEAVGGWLLLTARWIAKVIGD